MATLPIEVINELWQRASESEIGLEIKTNNPKDLRQQLLVARKSGLTPPFEGLMTFLPPSGDSVYICQKSAELPDA